MKHLKTFLYLILLGSGITACSPKYYAPDTHNVPLISEKGETNVAASGSTDRIEFQASRGITKNIAIKANGGYYSRKEGNDYYEEEDKNFGSGKFFEFGVGYFRPFQEGWVFETYGIFGMGSVENNLSPFQFSSVNTLEKISTKLRRIGIQPNVGYKAEDFSVAFSSRFVHLSYYDIEGNLIYEGEDQQNYLRNNNTHFLIEPAFTLGVNFNRFSIRAQAGLSLNATNFNFRQYKSSGSFIVNYSF